MANRQTYIIRIDTECQCCGAINQADSVTDYPVTAVACGTCGALFIVSNNVENEDIESIREAISETIEEKEIEGPIFLSEEDDAIL
jgi:hypothetical protein